jgi:hypothetical protein
MTDRGTTTFLEMARVFPVRTGVFTFVPLLFALSQFANSYLYGGPILFTGGFAAVVVGYAVLVHRHHLAAFHRSKLCSVERVN